MTELIEAATLDDALDFLARRTAENEALGRNNLIFCEDRLTLLAERAVLRHTGGTFRTEVTTFARYLSGAGKILSKQGSVMAVSSILSACRDRLQCFRAGAAEAVYETIAQFSASRVDAAALRASAAETGELLGRKLSDLALVLEEYRAFLDARGLLDENDYLALLPERLTPERLRAVDVIFFAFPSFTRRAAEGVRAAACAARSVTGVFVGGESAVYTNEGARIFRAVCRALGPVREERVQSSLSGEAWALRNGLFAPECLPDRPARSAGIRLFRPEDEAAEADAVCALIKRCTAPVSVGGEGLRYRDIAVLVPDERGFFAFEKAFSAYHIPYFADVRRPFVRHPFCAFVCAVLRAVADGGLPASVEAVAANVCFGDRGGYRNYLAKFGGFRGAVERPIREEAAGEEYTSLCAARERMRAVLKVFPARGTGRRFAEGVRALARLTDAEGVCARLEGYFSGAERAFLSLKPLEGLLEETAAVAGESALSAREFLTMFTSGLSAAKVAMIPNAADAVFVGDATQSRFARAEVVFATGMTDALPRISPDTAVVSDGDIQKLSSLRVEVEPTIAVVNARAREGLSLNLCAFRRALYVSCPLRRRGEETAVSEAVSYLTRLFVPAPLPEIWPHACSERAPAELALLHFAERRGTGRGAPEERYRALLRVLAEREGEALVRQLLAHGEKLPVPQAGTLYFMRGTASPTLLERYFECPYAVFLRSALCLVEREERPVQARDTGNFVHEILQRTAEAIGLLESEQACRAFADAEGRALLAQPRYAAMTDTAAGEYAAERLLKESAEIAAAAYRHVSGSAYRVLYTETLLSLPEIRLVGKADRVDAAGEYVRVIDYKTGRFDDTPAAYYTGRSLQLPLYLTAAAQGATPAGAFYFPAEDRFTRPGEGKFRLQGFFRREEEVLSLMDPACAEGESALFEGGPASRRGMEREEFEAFLSYALLAARQAEGEMAAGNIAPSPYEGACGYCPYRGACGFTGEARKAGNVTCADIARIAREGGKA